MSRRTAVTCVVAAVALAALGGASAAPRPSASPDEVPAIGTAFRHAFAPALSAAGARRYVEHGDVRLARALRNAASEYLAAFTRARRRLAVVASSVRPEGRRLAQVRFVVVIDGLPPTVERFTGGAVRAGGGWRVAWTTACFLVEFHHFPCPPRPQTLAPAPLPAAVPSPRVRHPAAAGLIRPSALAVAPTGACSSSTRRATRSSAAPPRAASPSSRAAAGAASQATTARPRPPCSTTPRR
jgi:hypothetical protein